MPVSPLLYQPDYPLKHEDMRREVLQVVKGDPRESARILACRLKSHCNSIFCPFCCEYSGYKRKDLLHGAAQGVDEGRLRFATFKALDVPLDGLREAGKRIMQASRAVLKVLKIEDYALSLETSFEEWRDEFHCHSHALIETASGGRKFISPRMWADAWLTALPADLHPFEKHGAAHVKPVRDLESSCYYLNKSPFWEQVASRENARRAVASIQALKGLPRFESRGSLTA